MGCLTFSGSSDSIAGAVYEGVNEFPLPLLDRRGGCAIKKILRSTYCRHRRGGCSNSNKSFEQPPRPLLVDASRLLLMSRPPLLSRRGNGAHPNSFTPSMTARDHNECNFRIVRCLQ